MRNIILSTTALLLLLTACGGGGGSTDPGGNTTPTTPTASVPVVTPTPTPTPTPENPYGYFRDINAVPTSTASGLRASVSTVMPTYTTLTDMTDPRRKLREGLAAHDALRLPDGRVLITGGTQTSGYLLDYSMVYEPVTERIYRTGFKFKYGLANDDRDTLSYGPNRTGHSSILWENGHAIYIGGDLHLTNGYLDGWSTIESVDFTQTVPVSTLRCKIPWLVGENVSYSIGGNRILGIGCNGEMEHNFFIIDITGFGDTDTWTVRHIPIPVAHPANFGGFSTVQLKDGRVVFMGGKDINWDLSKGIFMNYYSDIYVFDPETETITWKGNLPRPQETPALVEVAPNKIQIYGGTPDDLFYLDTVHELDTNTWTLTALPKLARPTHNGYRNCATRLLPNGFTIMFGGWTEDAHHETFIASSELVYDPKTYASGFTGEMVAPRAGASVTDMGDGTYLIIGGCTHPYGLTNIIEIFETTRRIYITLVSNVIKQGDSIQISADSRSVNTDLTWTPTYGTCIKDSNDPSKVIYTAPSRGLYTEAPKTDSIKVTDPKTGYSYTFTMYIM